MNIRSKPRASRRAGLTLIEMLVYMAVAVVVVGFTTATFYDCWENTKALRRNADDIARALDIGEHWRADMRAATGAIELTSANESEQLHIPVRAGAVTYTFANGEVRRQSNSAGRDIVWLSNVKSSRMLSETRGRVSAWRWELELKSSRKVPRLRPLFTFECAAGTAASP